MGSDSDDEGACVTGEMGQLCSYWSLETVDCIFSIALVLSIITKVYWEIGFRSGMNLYLIVRKPIFENQKDYLRCRYLRCQMRFHTKSCELELHRSIALEEPPPSACLQMTRTKCTERAQDTKEGKEIEASKVLGLQCEEGGHL